MEQMGNDEAQDVGLEVAEGFHLAFLVALQAAADPSTWALKGGGNLRFYFDSLRFSEDIDLDVFVEPWRNRPRIERAFSSATLAKLLASVGSKVDYLNPKERTDTKERWTIGLLNAAAGKARIYTQVELSYRSYHLERYLAIEAPKSAAAIGHAPIPPPTIGHYQPRGALIQKITALCDRRHTQPRDVFDVDHLVRKFPAAPAQGLLPDEILKAAIDRTFELTFELYRSNVVSFLEPSVRVAFDGPTHWTETQLRVAAVLEGMRQP